MKPRPPATTTTKTRRRPATPDATAAGAEAEPIPAHDSTWEILRSFPAPVWVLFAGTFVNKFGTFVVPFLTLYLVKQGHSPAVAASALAVYGVGHLGASLVGGILADVIGRRKTIALSMFAGAVAMVLLGSAESIGWIIVLSGLAGFAVEIYRPASSALITDLVPAESRVTAFAAYRLALNAGWALGPAAAGFLAQHSYQYLFWGEALTSAAFGAIALGFLPRGVRESQAGFRFQGTLRAIARDGLFLRLLVSYLLVGIVFFQMVSTMGVFVKGLDFDEAFYGKLLALNGLLVVLFEIPVTALTRRVPAPAAISLGFGLLAASGVVFAFATTPVWLVAAMALFTLGEIVSMPVAMAFAASLAPPEARGLYLGAVGLSWGVALVVGPPTMLALYYQAGPVAMWLVCAAIAAAGAALAAAAEPARRLSPVPREKPVAVPSDSA